MDKKLMFIFAGFVVIAALAAAGYNYVRGPKCDILGIASWYGDKEKGNQTASGQYFNPDSLTAAHRTIPFGTKLNIINIANKRSVIVAINDRGPFINGRVIDLSRQAARLIGMERKGIQEVRIIRFR